MNNELQAILNYMEKERGLDREILIQAVEYALQSASRKNLARNKDVRIEIDRKTYDIKAFAKKLVVEDVTHADEEVLFADALEIDPAAELGEFTEVEVTPRDFGRIAAQTAKQAIIQRIRQAEKDVVYEEYKDRVGDIVSGSVRQFNRSDIVIDLGRAEALLPSNERVPTEEYQIGDRIRAYVLDVRSESAGPGVVLSRSHPNFVRTLFELEVSEINDGIVEIKGIAREAGYRTKIAVLSHDEKVDPVGACVGMRGMRVKNIVRELSGEKIDIIRWSDDTRTYVANALSPAKLAKVTIDENDPGLVHVVADADQLSLAIGKRGQNVRLTAKLLGLKVDIQKDEQEADFEKQLAEAVEALAVVEGIGPVNAQALVTVGFLTVDGILAAEVSELAEMTGLELDVAQTIHDAAMGVKPVSAAADTEAEAASEVDAHAEAEALPEAIVEVEAEAEAEPTTEAEAETTPVEESPLEEAAIPDEATGDVTPAEAEAAEEVAASDDKEEKA
ncbi:MAG: transcription termination/antitermination protein NusA [Lentisphaerae bacterium]|nr:transcription termination/antitermination protein NusA [Lentisphaerota bacterium]